MKKKYSSFSLIKNAFSYHENWGKAWKDPVPKKEYIASASLITPGQPFDKPHY